MEDKYKYQSLSSEMETLSTEVSPGEVLQMLKINYLMQVFRYYYWVIILGAVLGGAYAFFTNITPKSFEVSTILRVRAIRSGTSQLAETVTIDEEAEELRAPKLIRKSLNELKHYTLVSPKDSILDKVLYFFDKYKNRRKLEVDVYDKYWIGLKTFDVDAGTGTYILRIESDDGYVLLDEDGDEILQGRLGELVENGGIQMQVDEIYADIGQEYFLDYLSKDSLTEWVAKSIKTKAEGKDGMGGTIEVTLRAYDKHFLLTFLKDFGHRHVKLTDQRLRRNILLTLEEHQEKKRYIEEDLFSLEKKLKKLQRQSVNKGNAAFTAKELQKQSKVTMEKISKLRLKKEKLQDKYDDVRTIFSGTHPIVVNALEDLERVEAQINELKYSSSNTPTLVLEISDLEENIKNRRKESQRLEEEVSRIESVYKLSKNYISVSHEPKVHPSGYALFVRRKTIIGALSGFLLSLLASLFVHVWQNRQPDAEDSTFENYDSESDRTRSDFSFQSLTNESEHDSMDLEYPFPSPQKTSEHLQLNFSGEFSSKTNGSINDAASLDSSVKFRYIGSDGYVREDELDSESIYEMSEELSLDESFYSIDSKDTDLHSVQEPLFELYSTEEESAQNPFTFGSISHKTEEQHVQLISKSVWSEQEFNARLRKKISRNGSCRVIGIVNSSTLDLSSAINSIVRKYKTKNAAVLIDTEVSESALARDLGLQGLTGFWELIRKKIPIKEALRKSALGFYVMPSGTFKPGHSLNRFPRVVELLADKFDFVFIHYPSIGSKWRELSSMLPMPQKIFVLQADYSLYCISREEEGRSESSSIAVDFERQEDEPVEPELQLLAPLERGKEFGRLLYETLSTTTNPNVIGVINQSDLPLSSIFASLRNFSTEDSPCVFVDADVETSDLTKFLQLESANGFWELLQKKSRLKEVLLQTSEDFYVVPCGGYSEDKLYIRNRCYRILKVLQQKFSRTIIHYPCEEEHWRNLIRASKAPQLLFLLSEDQELYQVELRAAKEVTKLRWSR